MLGRKYLKPRPGSVTTELTSAGFVPGGVEGSTGPDVLRALDGCFSPGVPGPWSKGQNQAWYLGGWWASPPGTSLSEPGQLQATALLWTLVKALTRVSEQGAVHRVQGWGISRSRFSLPQCWLRDHPSFSSPPWDVLPFSSLAKRTRIIEVLHTAVMDAGNELTRLLSTISRLRRGL